MSAWVVGGLCGLLFGAMALFGERWQRGLTERRLRRHHCPTPCEESRRCRCGCNGRWADGDQQACAVCGTPIVVDDEAPEPVVSYGEITAELPAPRGFTSWGWERDREFRRARHARRVWEGKEEGQDGHGSGAVDE